MMRTLNLPLSIACDTPRSTRYNSGTSLRLKCSASSSATDKYKPDWAGDDFLSKMVNSAINFKPLYEGVMKPMARNTLINTAEKNGVSWMGNVEKLEATPEVYEKFEELKDDTVEYPDYYKVPFHAYSEGNLCWQAAFEAEPATYSMALRVWPKEEIAWDAAQDRLRNSYTDCIVQHVEKYGLQRPKSIVDAGCSVGISTRAIHDVFPEANILGLDLSPYMLAVAAHRDETQFPNPGNGTRQWKHGLAEATGLPDSSTDLVSLAFMCHELPTAATRAVVKEAARILRPGGVLVLCDNNPKSPVIQNLPPVLFTLMKSTEPYSDEYYLLDFEALLAEHGFGDVHTEPSDPRHRTVLGTRI